jgi:hypothetical protein
MTATPEIAEHTAHQPGSSTEEPGLAKGVIKLPGVLFVAIATMAPGAGAAYSISTGALFGGGALALSVIFALVGSLLVATAIGQLAKHMSSAGGLASYVGTSMHNAAGFVIAWAYPFMYLFALPYLALVFGNLLATTLIPDGGTGFTVLWTVGALVCLAAAFATNYFGVEIGVRFGLILGIVEITVLVVMSVWMISVSGDNNSLSLFTTSHANIPGFEGINGVIAASVYGFLAFIGFEAAAPLAEETKNPRRNVPRAVLLSCRAHRVLVDRVLRPRQDGRLHGLQRGERVDRPGQDAVGSRVDRAGGSADDLVVRMHERRCACRDAKHLGDGPKCHHPIVLREGPSALAIAVQCHHRLLRTRHGSHARRRLRLGSGHGVCLVRNCPDGVRAPHLLRDRARLPGVLPAVST